MGENLNVPKLSTSSVYRAPGRVSRGTHSLQGPVSPHFAQAGIRHVPQEQRLGAESMSGTFWYLPDNEPGHGGDVKLSY